MTQRRRVWIPPRTMTDATSVARLLAHYARLHAGDMEGAAPDELTTIGAACAPGKIDAATALHIAQEMLWLAIENMPHDVQAPDRPAASHAKIYRKVWNAAARVLGLWCDLNIADDNARRPAGRMGGR